MARIVGLDIGSSAIRAVEVETRGRRPTIRKVGRVPLPHGVVEGGQVRAPAEVTKALRRLWHEQRFSTKAVRLGVSSGSVLARQVELDWMPPQDLRKAMRFLVADLLPVPIDEANIDHIVLEEVERPSADPDGEAKRMVRVLLVATAREGVDAVVRCVQAAGLRPTTADLSPLALVRTASMIAAAATTTEALVDVGSDKVSIAVHSHGRPRFVRVIPGIGGDSLTRALDEDEESGPGWAEQLKREVSLSVQGLTSSPLDDDSRSASPAAMERLRGAAQHIADEIADTLSYYAASDPAHLPTQVRLSGQGGTVHGFDALCASTLGLPVHHLLSGAQADPGSKSERRQLLPEPDLAISVGLCLGASA